MAFPLTTTDDVYDQRGHLLLRSNIQQRNKNKDKGGDRERAFEYYV